MTDTVTCPAEGCDYTGVENSVCAHYSGTRDDKHSGGYDRAKAKLEQQNSTNSTNSGNSGSSGSSGSSQNSTNSTNSRDSSPVFGDIDPDADPEPDESNHVELPCGCESYDPSDAPEPPYELTCTQCGKAWRVNE